VRISTFEGATLEEALARVKAALGDDALVLSTRERKRWWNQRAVIVVTAGVGVKPSKGRGKGFDEETLARVFAHRRTDDGRETRVPAEPASAAVASPPASRPAAPPHRAPPPRSRTEEIPGEALFLGVGVSRERARDLARRWIFDYPESKRQSPDLLASLAGRLLGQDLRCVPPAELTIAGSWALVGTAGAGKTSLAVKLALWTKGQGGSARLVTRDNRRLNARAELFGYARLIGVPCSVETRGVAGATTWIDTAAFGFDEDGEMVDLERTTKGSRVALVLDARCRLDEILRSVERAERLVPVALAFTHLDLCSRIGVIYDVMRATRMPLLAASVEGSLSGPLGLWDQREAGRRIVGWGGDLVPSQEGRPRRPLRVEAILGAEK